MCRNIRTLFNFDPPVTEAEIRAASLQFVRKLSGFNKPSKGNEVAFDKAVDEIAVVAEKLLTSLQTAAPPRDRAVEAAKARARAAANETGTARRSRRGLAASAARVDGHDVARTVLCRCGVPRTRTRGRVRAQLATRRACGTSGGARRSRGRRDRRRATGGHTWR